MEIAIVGATGLVGREILKILNQKKLIKNNNIYLYASKNSENKTIKLGGRSFVVKELNINNLENKYNFALFSAGSEISKKWAGEFIKRGATVVDNSSAFRRDVGKLLCVPEINGKKIKKNTIIANPNCSTIGVSLPIFALNKLYKIKKIIISTYQAVSGAGQKGLNDLKNGTKNKLKYKIKNNLIPQIDYFLDNGYTFEEDKMNFELKKILNNNKLNISTTCVRVPIKNCHSESVYVEFNKEPNIKEIKKALRNMDGIRVIENLGDLCFDKSNKYKKFFCANFAGGINADKENVYPMPILANGKNDVLVGRIRKDSACKNAISFFICFDNIRKGAALNAVQIMERVMCVKK